MKRLVIAVFISALLSSALVGIMFVKLGNADPYIVDWVKEGEVAPPTDAKPPTITIFSPENNTAYASNNITLTFNVSVPKGLSLTELYYRASWLKLRDISAWTSSYYYLPAQLSINLTDIPEGPHWLEVYAVAKGEIVTHQEITKNIYFTTYYVVFKMTDSSVINFTIDTTAPKISILALENKTYSTSTVPLNFTTNERISKSSYSLDGQENVTIAGNTTLTDLIEGEHNITVYAWDEAGNTGVSETIYFSVDVPFPTTVVVISVVSVVVGAGLLLYFKKRKR